MHGQFCMVTDKSRSAGGMIVTLERPVDGLGPYATSRRLGCPIAVFLDGTYIGPSKYGADENGVTLAASLEVEGSLPYSEIAITFVQEV